MFDIEWICKRSKKGEYYFLKHGDHERQNDNLIVAEVEEALLAGRIIEQYGDTVRRNSYLIGGFTEAGKPIHNCLRKERRLVSCYNSLYPSSA